MLHQALIGHIPNICSMICAKFMAAALVIRAVRGRSILHGLCDSQGEESLRYSGSPMDSGQSGRTFRIMLMHNNIHRDYANFHITSTAAAQCLTGDHFDSSFIVQIEHTWNTITSFRWLRYEL